MTAGGRARTSTIVTALIDTNILVYRFDPRFADKQRRASELLRNGIEGGRVRIAHQALVEFFAAVTRRLPGHGALLSRDDARRETEELLSQIPVLYPNEAIVRSAVRATAAYQLSWFDAHMWSYADHYGLNELITEDFQHDRMYGQVRAINPFLGSG